MVDLSKVSEAVKKTVANIMKMDGNENKVDSKREYDELGQLLSGKHRLKGKDEVGYVEGLMFEYADREMVSEDTRARVFAIIETGQNNKADDANEIEQLRALLKTKGLSDEDKAFIKRVIEGHEVKIEDEAQPKEPPVAEPPKDTEPPVAEPPKDTKPPVAEPPKDTKPPVAEPPRDIITLPVKPPKTLPPVAKKPVDEDDFQKFLKKIIDDYNEKHPAPKPVKQEPGDFDFQRIIELYEMAKSRPLTSAEKDEIIKLSQDMNKPVE